MKTSTIIFNVAAVITLVGIFIALVDLMKNKTHSYGITPSPTVVPTTMPDGDATYMAGTGVPTL